MSAVNNIIYQSVVYLAPVLLCVLGGIFAYRPMCSISRWRA